MLGAGKIGSQVLGSFAPCAEPTPTCTFSYHGANANKLIGSDSTMEYSFDNGLEWTECSLDTDLSSVRGGITEADGIAVRARETAFNAAGDQQRLYPGAAPMRYKVADIEDQIMDTLKADTTNFTNVMIDTFAGQISAQMFMNPEYMQGFMKILPFCLVSYQGRIGAKSDRDSAGKIYIHTLTFRLFIGAQSLRSTQESARAAYDMLAAIYDDLHAKVPKCTPQQLGGYTPLSGTAITTSEFNPITALFETGGTDEALVVNLPGIVCYRSDYNIKLLA